MNFKFIINKNLLALHILKREMHNESKEIKNIKKNFKRTNKVGYNKIIGTELLDTSIYLKDKDIKKLVNEFVAREELIDTFKKFPNINKNTLALKILSNEIKVENIVDVLNYLWDKHREGYQKIQSFTFVDVKNYLKDYDSKLLIKAFIKTKEFNKLYKETTEYLTKVKSQWEENKKRIKDYLNNILRINFDLNITVYITHPNTYKGCALPNNKILWGHFKGLVDPYYNLTYLIHEWLHCFLPYSNKYNQEESALHHTVIELISDYELYSLLRNGSTYNEGHPHLKQYKEFIYPYWLQYIGLTEKEIQNRYKEDNIQYKKNTFPKNLKLKFMNILEFIYFICREYKKMKINKRSIYD